MGILGSLFGRSDPKDDVVGERCNDCGMAGGTHTDWCPTASTREGDRPGSAGGEEDAASNDGAPARP